MNAYENICTNNAQIIGRRVIIAFISCIYVLDTFIGCRGLQYSHKKRS